MSTVVNDTVADIAERQNIDVQKLLDNIALAGLPQKESTDSISSQDVAVLVDYMRKQQSTVSGTEDSRPEDRQTASAGSGVGRRDAPGGVGTLTRSRPTSLGLQRPSSTVRVAKVRRRRIVRKESPAQGSPTAPSIEPPTPATPPSAIDAGAAVKESEIGVTDDQVQSKAQTAKTSTESIPPTTKPSGSELSQLELEKERIRQEEAKRVAAEEEIRRKQQERSEESRQRQEAERLRSEELERARVDREKAQEQAREEEVRRQREVAEAAARAEAEAINVERGGKRRDERKQRGGRTSISEPLDLRGAGAKRSTSSRRRTLRERSKKRTFEVTKTGGEFSKPIEKVVHDVEISEAITVGELARKMSVKSAEVITTLMKLGEMVTINQTIDTDTATLVVEEMGHRAHIVSSDPMEEELVAAQQMEGTAESRSPVIVVMGHVDHGKTSLLDYIRNSRVVSEEQGGITQHIGAYHLTTPHGSMTFLDTPGHAAFSAMRARGASATDIAVLVCAADDGVMPQTEEAVQHALAAKVPMIVAVNKIDLPGVDPGRVRNELNAIGVTPEEWGGETQFVDVSAETGEGIEDLLTSISLLAEVHEFKAYPESIAKGVVIESKLDRGRGPVATLLVQNGTLRKGDIVLAGEYFGKVRSLVNDQGAVVDEAMPSIPVEVLGLNGAPSAGDDFNVALDERQARQLASSRLTKNQQKHTVLRQTSRLESMFANLGRGEKRILNIVLKTDVRGSLEAISHACAEIGNDEVAVQVLGSGVGGITESDVNMSIAYDAMIFGFNVRLDNAAKRIVEQNSVEVRYYSIIYELLDDIKRILEDMLVPELREEILGTAEVRDVFHSPRFGNVAGCMVVEGSVSRNKKIRVLRDSTVIYEGELESLRRFKDDVLEVRNGFECGIGVRNYNDVREGDRIEVFESREVARAL